MFVSTCESKTFPLEDVFWKYSLVAYPDENVLEKVAEEKKLLDQISGYTNRWTRPQIQIASFYVLERMEETLTRWIQNICNLQNSFKVCLNNFSGFPPHTIYLRVQDNQPFQRLTSALTMLDGFILSNGCPPMHLESRPYLSLAGGLSQQVYEHVLPVFAQRNFHESFMVEKLVLLKSDIETENKVINTFTLPSSLTLSH